jgi:hypothetical protein
MDWQAQTVAHTNMCDIVVYPRGGERLFTPRTCRLAACHAACRRTREPNLYVCRGVSLLFSRLALSRPPPPAFRIRALTTLDSSISLFLPPSYILYPKDPPIIYYRRAEWARFPSRRCDQFTSALFGDFVLELSAFI